MAIKQGGGKRKRQSKTSKGIHGGGGKVRLTPLEKALISSTFLAGLSGQRNARIERDGVRR